MNTKLIQKIVNLYLTPLKIVFGNFIQKKQKEEEKRRCLNMNGRTSNGTSTTIMATIRFYIWSAAAAAATAAAAVSGCAGDDHERENDRFVYV
jgi:hypothetical protein